MVAGRVLGAACRNASIMMTSRPGKWRRLRGILAGILLILPLFQLAAPGLLAVAADDGVWCQSLASLDGQSNPQGHVPDADDCLVCVVTALGGSTATPQPPAIPALPVGTMASAQVSLTCPDDVLALTQPPIRAPPFA